jgi:hypothetical protein
MSRDWRAWHEQYDDPASSLSRRLVVVREQLAGELTSREGDVRLLSLCSGKGRDTLPVLAEHGGRVDATLVELDVDLADAACRDAAAQGLEVDVRTGDAGLSATWADVVPVHVLMLCGVFGNLADDDVRRTVTALPLLLTAGGSVIWTRGRAVPGDLSQVEGDPAEWVRGLFDASPASEYAAAAVRATNAAREANDRRPLKVNECLRGFAVKQARAMAAAEEIYHQDLGPIMDACGLVTAGENVAYGYPTGRAVVNQGWMKSAGHRANILSRSYRLVAVSARRDDGTWYAAQVFGRRG